MNTSTSPLTGRETHSASRLPTVRRLYFYLVALISFIAALAGFDSLVQQLTNAWLGSAIGEAVYDAAYMRQAMARSGGLLLVATPIFLLHWGYMHRRRHEPGELGAGLRKFFLYASSGVAIFYILTNGQRFLSAVTRLALGEPAADSAIWPSEWLYLLIMITASLALQIYFHTVLVGDGDYGHERGAAGTWRRLYQALAGLVGLALIIQGTADIIASGWRALTEMSVDALATAAGWWRYDLGSGVAMTLMGSVLARVNWQRWLRITAAAPVEGVTALRRLYLYVAVVISALATLIPAAALLREILLVSFGSPSATWSNVLDTLRDSLPYVPAGLASWVWHWRVLHREAEAYGESTEGATVRRLYYYAVAATGLALLWFGAVNVLQAGLDRLFVAAQENRFWIEPLATGLSLLAVGAPIWSLHWQTVQTQARRTDTPGAQERASLPRRIYLYGVALTGALLILFYLAQVVYRLLLMLLGDPDAGLLSASTVADIARSAIAALLWAVHLLAIRGDTRLAGSEPALAPLPVADERAALQHRIEHLEAELANAKAALAALEETQA